MEYLDFDLEIGDGNGHEYPLNVRCQDGQASATLRFPFGKPALRDHLENLRTALRSGGSPRSSSPEALTSDALPVRAFGQRLFDALMVGDVRTLYDVSRRAAKLRRQGVRLRLHVKAPEMAALPWEYLYDNRTGEYLCLSSETPLVRTLELLYDAQQPLRVAPPLRILGVIASPSNLEPLDLAREQQRIQTALHDLEDAGLVTLTWLGGQTWRDLHRALADESWHILHFIGHGGFDPDEGEGVIALVSEENGKAHLLTATQMSNLLANHHSLRLVLLNACEGARAADNDLFSSTAATLARRGIPAVLAMQEKITDAAAIELTRTFYDELARGRPVDAAVAEARTAIHLSRHNSLEWGMPVLYMCAQDGVLFDLAKMAEKSSPPSDVPVNPPNPSPPRQEPKPPPRFRFPWDPPPPAPDEPKTAQDWLNKGHAYLQAQEYEKAQAAYEQAGKRDPTDASAFRFRAEALNALKRFDEARKACDQAITKLNDHDPATYTIRGHALTGLKRFNEALAAYADARNLRADYPDALIGTGEVLNQLQQYEKAVPYFERAAELRPLSIPAWTGQGQARISLKHYTQALAAWNHVTELEPGHFQAYLNKGDALMGLHHFDQALEAYEKAIQINSNQANAHYGKGMALRAEQRYEAALAAFKEALRLMPGFADARIWQGATLSALQLYRQALDALNQAIQLDKRSPLAYQYKGVAHFALGEYQQALGAFEQVLKWDAQNASAWQNKAETLKQFNNRTAEALAAFEQAYHLDPTREAAYRGRGWLLMSLQRYQEALKHWELMLDLFPNNTIALEQRELARKGVERQQAEEEEKRRQEEREEAEAPIGTSLAVFQGSFGLLNGVAWAPDGRQLAFCSIKGQKGMVRLCPAPLVDGEQVIFDGQMGGVHAISWSPDGQRLATAGDDKTVQLWDVSSRNLLHVLRGHTAAVEAVAWSPDSKFLVSASTDQTIRVWDTASGKELIVLSGHTGVVTGVAWSPQEERLASASADGTIRLWAPGRSKPLHTLKAQTRWVHTVAWSPDGQYLASGGDDHLILLWQVNSRKKLGALKGHSKGVRCVAWSPDGKRLASASEDYTVRLWNPTSGQIIKTLGREFTPPVFIEDESEEESEDENDNDWINATQDEIQDEESHTSVVRHIAWSPNGKRLASASWDGTVRIWKV